jgi:hypothetical protein
MKRRDSEDSKKRKRADRNAGPTFSLWKIELLLFGGDKPWDSSPML